jgi:sulfur carrier protein ThiS adenylyltransferase
MTDSSDRFARQSGLVPHQLLAQLDVTIIGVGAIGRQLALQLASFGVRKLRLVDFDVVEATNTTTQGYLQEDLGLLKVVATGRAIQRIDWSVVLDLVEDRFRAKMAIGEIVFCCVDSISARDAIWRMIGHRCQFWCDGRMLGEVMRVLTVADREGRDHYSTALFPQAEVQAGACTARGVIYTAAIAGGLMVHQFARWLRQLPIDHDVSFNLLANELVAD